MNPDPPNDPPPIDLPPNDPPPHADDPHFMPKLSRIGARPEGVQLRRPLLLLGAVVAVIFFLSWFAQAMRYEAQQLQASQQQQQQPSPARDMTIELVTSTVAR